MSEQLRPLISYFRVGREDERNRIAERIKESQSKPNINQTKAQKQLERLGLLFRNGIIDEGEYREFVSRVKEKYTNE